ncbi:MAG: mechanosensitive ion channel [Alphaproteobacteria bacterium]|nr:mechanosensitive ion channel [Alphaproteobacteria bacterium]
MSDFWNTATLQKWFAAAEAWLRDDVLVVANLIQLGGVLAALIVARLATPAARRGCARLKSRVGAGGWVARALQEFDDNLLPIIWLAIQWPMYLLASGTPLGGKPIEVTVSLLAAWVVIQFTSILIRDPALRRTAAILAWTVAALNIIDLLDPLIDALDRVAVDLGGFRLSVLVVIKGLILFAILLWLALFFSQSLERRLSASQRLSPSVRVLFGQLSKIILITVAIVVALASVGVDLTAFAVFTGALGVGLGLGLQKVVGNLFSGVLLLIDRSIKPGDVIVVGDTYGWINFMGARYVSVVTRDGTEHLIPNETLITTPVENWSYSNNLLRLRIPIGISYKSDPHKAIALVLEAAKEVARVLDEPKTVVLVTGFGDSSVDLEVRIWINDPRNGISNVKSEVLLRVWDKFHAAGIEIPFPQRDLHIKSNEADFSAGPSGA